MPAWIIYLPTILSALVELTKLLVNLAKEKNQEQIKECSIAIEEARKSGDTSKLTDLIEKMKRGKPCR